MGNDQDHQESHQESFTNGISLLSSSERCDQRRKHWNPNPLPWRQLSVVLLNRVCDALAGQSIGPYINQRVGELDIVGGDKRKVGYYVGIIDSLSQAALTITILQWNRLSDYIGRKPVLLIGTFGSMLAILCFGLSQTYWGLVASGCLWGLLDSNVGITKSIVGELTDSTNRARGFSLIFVLWAVGGTIGPLIGGTLARPSDRFPSLFGDPFWERYPYFLPCFVVSIAIAISFLITFFFFEETVLQKPSLFRSQAPEEASFLPSDDKPLPLRQILIYPVIIAVGNHMALSFLATSHTSLFPLFCSMPIEIGGLGFDPPRIGYVIGAYRAISATFMATLFPRVVQLVGERRLYIFSICSFPVLWAFLPVINLLARNFGIGAMVWISLALMVVPIICLDMGYSCIFIFVTSAAPNKRSLGTTNGVSQTSVSIACTVAPALATSLFSFSVEHNFLGGYAVYAVFFGLSCFALLLALRLPHKPRSAWEEEEVWDDDESDSDIDLRGVRHGQHQLGYSPLLNENEHGNQMT